MIDIPMLSLTAHGGNRVLIDIANFLDSQGLRVRILTTYKDPDLVYKINEGVEIIKIFNYFDSKYIRWILFFLFSGFFIKGKSVIANHFLTAFPSRFSRFIYGGKMFYFVQDIEFEFYNSYGLLGKILKILCIYSYRFGFIISANPYLSKRLKIFTVVDFDFNLGVHSRLCQNIQKKCFDVVYFLRSEPHKGVPRFDDIINLNKDLKFLCISQDQDLLSKYSKIENIHIEKPRCDDELYNLLAQAKVCLLTSYHEGFSLPPLECMTQGVPLVFFPCGGPSVYTNDLNSVEINSCSDFRMAYNKISDNYPYYVEGSKTTSSNFSMDKSLMRFYKYLCEK